MQIAHPGPLCAAGGAFTLSLRREGSWLWHATRPEPCRREYARVLPGVALPDSPSPPGSDGLPLVGETLAFASNPFGFCSARVAEHGAVVRSEVAGRPLNPARRTRDGRGLPGRGERASGGRAAAPRGGALRAGGGQPARRRRTPAAQGARDGGRRLESDRPLPPRQPAAAPSPAGRLARAGDRRPPDGCAARELRADAVELRRDRARRRDAAALRRGLRGLRQGAGRAALRHPR